MSHPHSFREFQQGIGQTGRLGEFFLGLGAFILVGGMILFAVGENASAAPGHAGGVDAVTAGFLYAVGGLGVLVFGALVVLAGWGRHHEDGPGGF